jgi:hypothetical protein
VVPTRLLAVYVDRPHDVEQARDLRPAEAGANVALFTPFGDVVFERTSPPGRFCWTRSTHLAAGAGP